MKRRNFLAGIGPLAVAPALSFAGVQKTVEDNQQYLEWIHYTLPAGSNKNRVEKYYETAAIPALNRLGISNVGVFNVIYGPNSPSLYVLIPHNSMDSLLTYQQKLMKDGEYMKAAREYHSSDISNPAYTRMERSLMLAFKGMPKVESAIKTIGDERIFEFRIYEAHNYQKGQKKIDMFNAGGEIQVFRDTGLTPVFFGETVFGQLMPNLSYMLAFKDMETRNKNWDIFRVSDGWVAIKDLEEYKDTVSNITDIIMRPAKCSQI
jgi:hypothetical protein